MKKFFILNIISILIFSCQKEKNTIEHVEPLTMEEWISLQTGKRNVDEISDIALTAFQKQFSGLTKSYVTPTISEIIVGRNNSQMIKSSMDYQTDTIVYVANFDNDQGFAIVSADKRVTPILGISNNGNIKDTIDNPGMALVLSMIPYYIESEKMRMDSIYQIAKIKLEKGATFKTNEIKSDITYSAIGPLIQTNWNQTWPWNADIPHTCNDLPAAYQGRSPAGCVAIATGQILAHYRRPHSLITGFTLGPNGWEYTYYPLRWDDMIFPLTEAGRTDVAKFIYDLTGQMATTFGCANGSSTSLDNIVTALHGNHFYCNNPQEHAWAAYDNVHGPNVVSADIAQHHRPVIMVGFSHEEEAGFWPFKYNTFKKGHAWIVDGVASYGADISALVGQPAWLPVPMYHINWGWGGSQDGWFVIGVFNANLPLRTLPPMQTLAKAATDEDYNYVYSLKYINGIYPMF